MPRQPNTKQPKMALATPIQLKSQGKKASGANRWKPPMMIVSRQTMVGGRVPTGGGMRREWELVAGAIVADEDELVDDNELS